MKRIDAKELITQLSVISVVYTANFKAYVLILQLL